MNTQVKGQQGYKRDNIFDKMNAAEKMYDQYKWIIKWENKWLTNLYKPEEPAIEII